MAKKNLPAKDAEKYAGLIGDIKQRIRSARYRAIKAVNRELIDLYWDIGEIIVTRQEGETWGKSVVQNIAKDLRQEFPKITGFSASNLWRMKLFYESYQLSEKLAPMVREIGWSHNLTILEKCKEELEREFYIRMTRRYGWTKNVLIRLCIESEKFWPLRLRFSHAKGLKSNF